eukprot:795299-Pyramimonas_sp.AAC.1
MCTHRGVKVLECVIVFDALPDGLYIPMRIRLYNPNYQAYKVQPEVHENLPRVTTLAGTGDRSSGPIAMQKRRWTCSLSVQEPHLI